MITATIIGCGHGGQTLAADLKQRGCNVTLYAHPQHPGGFDAIHKTKQLNCSGLINGRIPITNITMNLQHAITNSDYIFIVLPSYAHEALFTEMVPFLQSGQTVVTLAANFASLVLLRLLQKANKKNIELIDVASLPYVCRADNAGAVEIISIKEKIAAASIPATALTKHLPVLSSFFPAKLIPYRDVLSLGMNITSGITHPAITLLNAGRIGKDKEKFYFYREGMTPEIASLLEQLDEERMLIGRYFNLEMHSYLDLMEQYYSTRYDSIYDFFCKSSVHSALHLCPASLQERYITQDVAHLLVPWYCLGKLAQIKSPVLNSLITLASLLNHTDYLATGNNLNKLNLHNKTLDQITQVTA
jgi:opine dehydrogenase